MARIKLTWHSDIQDNLYSVFKSETTLDLNNLPEPVVQNITELVYIDLEVIPDTIYFYRVMSKYNNKEYFSEEVIASITPPTLFVFNNNENYTSPSGISVNFIMDD